MRKLVNGLHKALMNMALLILDYMPWAVIALLANTIAQKGLDSILSVVHFIFVLYLAIIAQFIIQLIALSVNGINPIVYMKKSLALLILAFTSRSSVGCLPITIETLTQKFRRKSSNSKFCSWFWYNSWYARLCRNFSFIINCLCMPFDRNSYGF